MKKAIAVAMLCVLVSGCATVREQDKFTIGQLSPLVTQDELGKLYTKHGFGTDEEFKVGDKKPSPQIRRNELQNVLLGIATQKCAEFKTKLGTKLKRDSFRFGMGAQLLGVAGAATVHELTAKALAATGAAAATLQSMYGTTYEVASLNVAMSGIERARTRVFLQLQRSMKKDLLEYPVARAVNDAFRYHSVCTLTDGLIEASRAASSTPPSPSPSEEPDEEPEPNGDGDASPTGGEDTAPPVNGSEAEAATGDENAQETDADKS